MKKENDTQALSNRGFSLVELLVVMTIISILTAVLIPVVQSAITRARMTESLANGRSIYQSLFADRDQGTGLPKSTGAGAFSSSTDYWRQVVSEERIKVTFDFFSADGLASYAGLKPEKFLPEHNAWQVVADLSWSDHSATPVFMTRNLALERLDSPLADAMTEESPFGSHGVVVIRMGGHGDVLKRHDLDPEFFNPTEASNLILKP